MSKIYQLEDIHNHGIDVENRIVYVNSESEYEGEESGVDYKMARTFMRNMDYYNRCDKDYYKDCTLNRKK